MGRGPGMPSAPLPTSKSLPMKVPCPSSSNGSRLPLSAKFQLSAGGLPTMPPTSAWVSESTSVSISATTTLADPLVMSQASSAWIIARLSDGGIFRLPGARVERLRRCLQIIQPDVGSSANSDAVGSVQHGERPH